MTQPPALAEALALAWSGIHVFPCKARAKEPATPHGFKDATVDPEQIARWWHAEPSLNVAAATGQLSGIFVVDVDGPAAEVELRKLESERGDLPETATVFTARGAHRWFAYGTAPASSRLASNVGATGGFVLVPPSIHPSGTRYRWARAGQRSPPRRAG